MNREMRVFSSLYLYKYVYTYYLYLKMSHKSLLKGNRLSPFSYNEIIFYRSFLSVLEGQLLFLGGFVGLFVGLFVFMFGVCVVVFCFGLIKHIFF